MADVSDKILRLYTRLNSLKQNSPVSINVDEKYVKEYHLIIKELQDSTQSDLAEFLISEGEVAPIVRSFNRRTREKDYSRSRYCERSFLLTKLDALLSYFQIKYLSKEKQEFGFGRAS